MLPPGCVDACPGCRYRGLPAAESDEKKEAWARKWLGPSVRPLRAPKERLAYRRKTLLHAGKDESGSWSLGLLKRTGWDTELVPIPECPAHAPELNRLLARLLYLLHPGIPLAFVQASGALLTLVLKCKASEEWRAWARGTEAELRAAGASGLQLNWNPSAGRKAVSSRHQELVFGPRFVSDGEVLHGALSFRQQIPELEREALSLALDFLKKSNSGVAVDLYSGAGASLALWEKQGWRCAGVELGGEAAEAAKLNAPASVVLKGKVEQRLPQLDEFLGKEDFLVYTNPPREGMLEEVCRWLLERRPEAIAYLSCNPRSQAADLALLAPAYRLVSAQPFDFFPGTDHVECLALLARSP